NNLAVLHAAANRPDEALRLLGQVVAIDDRMFGQVFSIGSETQRAEFAQRLRTNLEILLSLFLRHLGGVPAAVRAAADLVLRRKAVGAEALAAQRAAILGGRYPALQPRLRELTAVRLQIAQQTLAGPGSEDAAAHRQRLTRLSEERERLEAELARQV